MSTFNMKLRKPISTIQGERIDEVAMDFDALTGEDIMDASYYAYGECLKHGVNPAQTVPELTKAYQLVMASRAMGLPLETVKQMNVKDLTILTTEVSNFLLLADTV